jgi:hypothetical protein
MVAAESPEGFQVRVSGSVMSDSERTRAAAGEAIVGALRLSGGALLTRVNGFGSTIGLVLIVLGAAGAAHAVLLGLGLVRLPDDHHGEGERPPRYRHESSAIAPI